MLFIRIISSYFDIDFFEIGTRKLLVIIVDVTVYQIARIRKNANDTKVGTYYVQTLSTYFIFIWLAVIDLLKIIQGLRLLK